MLDVQDVILKKKERTFLQRRCCSQQAVRVQVEAVKSLSNAQVGTQREKADDRRVGDWLLSLGTWNTYRVGVCQLVEFGGIRLAIRHGAVLLNSIVLAVVNHVAHAILCFSWRRLDGT